MNSLILSFNKYFLIYTNNFQDRIFLFITLSLILVDLAVFLISLRKLNKNALRRSFYRKLAIWLCICNMISLAILCLQSVNIAYSEYFLVDVLAYSMYVILVIYFTFNWFSRVKRIQKNIKELHKKNIYIPKPKNR